VFISEGHNTLISIGP